MGKYKTLDFDADCADRFNAVVETKDGKKHLNEGYPPGFLGNGVIHSCDSVSLKIDLETGQILNWKKPTDEQIEKWFGETMEEEFTGFY